MTDPQLMLRTKMLGAMMRAARVKAGKSLSAAAASIGSTPSKLSSFEHGRKGISLPELELLAYSLKVPLDHFLNPEGVEEERERRFDPNVVIKLRQRMIGATLRKHREHMEMTKKQLSEAVGVPVSRITAYERGDRPVPLAELEAMLGWFGRSVDDYVDNEGPVGSWNQSQQAFRAYQKLPAEVRETLARRDHMIFIQLAKMLRELPGEQLRTLGKLLLDVVG